MSCEDLDFIVKTPSAGDKGRKRALKQLIMGGCIPSLYNHAQTVSRMEWIRNYALLALAKFASLNTESEEAAITLQDDEILVDEDLDRKNLRKKAAKYLFLFAATPKKPRKMKKIALMGLIRGKHWAYCDELMKDANVEAWVKKSIQTVKKR